MTHRNPRDPSFLALVLVTGINPLATDTYIAALPAVARSLHTGSGPAQLTMTAFILGLAAGQLVLGPISDGVGRRPMLVGSSALFALLSAACALAPGIGVLVTLRALQGFAGGCGVAVGRAVVSDQYAGIAAARRYGTLAAVTLLGPVLAPAVGGIVLLVGDWRSVFWLLTGIGVLMTLAVGLGVPETLPPERRHPDALRGSAPRIAALLRRRAFITPVLVQCLATAGFFTYIGGSSFVLQNSLGLTRTGYTVLFATNAAGMALASATFRATVGRYGAVRLRAVGITMSATAVVALAGYALFAGGRVALAPVWVLLAVVVAGMGLSIPATTTLAQEAGRSTGGTASALQGSLTFGVGAAATPLTGVFGVETARGMAVIMAVCFVTAVTAVTVLGTRPTEVGVTGDTRPMGTRRPRTPTP